jgi:hypothetical protein
MTRSTITPSVALALALATLAFGCSSNSTAETTDSGEKHDSGETTGTTFTKVYKDQITGYKCLTCHVPGQIGVTDGKLDMSTQALAYENLVNVKAAGDACGTSGLTRVVPGSASTSLIVTKTDTNESHTPPPCGVQMPLGCGKTAGLKCLGGDDVTPLESWINAGAQNN